MQLRKHFLVETAAEPKEWIALADLAEIWVSSEDAHHPIEAALLDVDTGGWRAAGPGPQTIRIVFERPQDVRRIELSFEEHNEACVQEFSLRWSADRGRIFHPIVRQQFTFSPAAATRQLESYEVALQGVVVFDLDVIPDVSHGARVATLKSLRLG